MSLMFIVQKEQQMFSQTNHILVPSLVADVFYIIGLTIAIITGLMISDNELARAGVRLNPESD